MVINCYLFKETLLYLFIKLTLNYDNNNSFYFLTTNITEVFIAYINLSYFITNQIIILFICYQVFIFITPGLYKFEYVYLKTIFIVITSC